MNFLFQRGFDSEALGTLDDTVHSVRIACYRLTIKMHDLGERRHVPYGVAQNSVVTYSFRVLHDEESRKKGICCSEDYLFGYLLILSTFCTFVTDTKLKVSKYHRRNEQTAASHRKMKGGRNEVLIQQLFQLNVNSADFE